MATRARGAELAGLHRPHDERVDRERRPTATIGREETDTVAVHDDVHAQLARARLMQVHARPREWQPHAVGPSAAADQSPPTRGKRAADLASLQG